jgi:hypothetical protein
MGEPKKFAGAIQASDVVLTEGHSEPCEKFHKAFAPPKMRW